MTVTAGSGAGPRFADPDRFLKILDDPVYALVVDLQDLVSVETTMFWSRRGLRTMHLPITTAAISSPMGLGSDSRPVEVRLFEERTYLADSMQFMLEYGCRLAEAGCYYIMPCFRGEDPDATHLNQFFHSEAEIPGGLDDVMAVVEQYVRHLAAAALERHGDRIGQVAGTAAHVRRLLEGGPFPRLTFDEAVARLGGDPRCVRKEADWRVLTREGELRLLAQVSPVLWVSHYDHLAVPFYQGYADSGRRQALNADLLLGLGELVGCGERHTSAESLLDALCLHEVEPSHYSWYVTMKRERPLRTSGFGLGIERFVAWLLAHDDIRDIPLIQRLKGMRAEP